MIAFMMNLSNGDCILKRVTVDAGKKEGAAFRGSTDSLSAVREQLVQVSKRRQDAGEPQAGCLRSLRYFAASSPLSFMISKVISAAAYMSFTSSHSLTV